MIKLGKGLKYFLYIAAAAVLLLICIAPIILPTLRENARQISCASNLVSLGLSLQQYAMDFKDYFPDKNGTAGLEMLQRECYCSDAKIYICPSSGQVPSPLKKTLIASYEYHGGLKFSPEQYSQPLMWDKRGNHRNTWNVLFCDGHVETICITNGKIIGKKFFKRFPNCYQAPVERQGLPPEFVSGLTGKSPAHSVLIIKQ